MAGKTQQAATGLYIIYSVGLGLVGEQILKSDLKMNLMRLFSLELT